VSCGGWSAPIAILWFRETPRSRLLFQDHAVQLSAPEQKLIDIFPELLANNAICRD